MKPNKNHNKGITNMQLVPIRFEFNHSTARTVCIAGTFNAWHPTTKAMQRFRDGHWMKVAFLPPGNHEYCLVVDGQWMLDPLARGSVANPFGGRNSVLKVTSPSEAAHLAAAENLPLGITNQPKYTKKI